MTFQPLTANASLPAIERTPLSHEFEAFYRALPRAGRMPLRNVFRPEKAARFLRHIVLCEIPIGDRPAIRMRLIGSAVEENVQYNIAGHDFLEYLAAPYHASALEASRHLISRPCGLWQITPLHYERGYGHNVEITAFPLAPEPHGAHVLAVLTQTPGAAIDGVPTGGKPIVAGTARAFHYIDLGAGIPQ
jgi:hypothetical protein